MKKRYLLIKTDGYSIDTCFRDTYQEAEAQMRKEYLDAKPEEEEWDESWAEMSYLESHDAILYTGENVFVWRILKVTEDEK